ncbi:MAG: hybrid sensor histidine kinase/response regulator [Lachnospiraceae bacterium]
MKRLSIVFGIDNIIALAVILLVFLVLGWLLRRYIIKQQKAVEEYKEQAEKFRTEYEKAVLEKEKHEHDNIAKTAFLNSMAGQLRTPLSTILGMDEILKEKEFDKESSEYLENIYSAGKIMESLLNDLSDLSKIEKGQLFVEEAPYSIAEVIRETYTLIKTRADNKSIDLQLEFDENLPSVLRGDGNRMKQVVLNLLANAVAYTPIGKVSYQVTFEQTDEKTICLKVQVKDTGIGIKEEDMRQAFGQFHEKIDPLDRLLDGLGLGLTVTNQILQQMGSCLEAESEYGQGSVFRFSLKQEVEDATPIGNKERVFRDTEKQVTEEGQEFLAPDAKLLAVDDNRMNLAVINGILKKSKMQVDCAASGKECLEAVQKKKYDIILLDHMMPDMDGIMTLKKMRSMEENLSKDAPVVVVTASAASGVRDFYLREGFDDYISKPIEVAVLYKTIRKNLPEELISNPNSTQQQIATDVKSIQETIEKNMTAEDVIRTARAVEQDMMQFNLEHAMLLLRKLKEANVPEEYRENISEAVRCMEEENYEKAAGFLDAMSKSVE